MPFTSNLAFHSAMNSSLVDSWWLCLAPYVPRWEDISLFLSATRVPHMHDGRWGIYLDANEIRFWWSLLQALSYIFLNTSLPNMALDIGFNLSGCLFASIECFLNLITNIQRMNWRSAIFTWCENFLMAALESPLLGYETVIGLIDNRAK